MPIGHQVILMQFNPSLNQLHLSFWQIALQQFAVGDFENRLEIVVA
jgi:hypothetical protein